MNRIWLLVGLLALIPNSGALAQSGGRDALVREMDMTALADQPGYVPNPSEEQLSVSYQRQAVFFRTNEAPGTIIVHSSTRYLYLVQGNNRAIRYGIGF